MQAKQVTEKVSAIIWKYNKNKVAEWFEKDDVPTYFDIFESVTTLDMQTWALNISNLQPHFSGKYSAEVNNKDPTQSADVVHLFIKIIRVRVPKV